MYTAEALREHGIAIVSHNSGDFMTDGIIAIAKLDPGEYTGENIRVILTKAGIMPHHPNAWGALIMQAVRKKLIIDTGKLKNMETLKSHARKTTVYQIR